jgi:hypothetical protein
LLLLLVLVCCCSGCCWLCFRCTFCLCCWLILDSCSLRYIDCWFCCLVAIDLLCVVLFTLPGWVVWLLLLICSVTFYRVRCCYICFVVTFVTLQFFVVFYC